MSDDHWKKNISSSSGGGYRPLYDDVEVNKPTEREETVRERAERQRRERRAELTYTEKDYARWERNRKRKQLETEVHKATKELLVFLLALDLETVIHSQAVKEFSEAFDVILKGHREERISYDTGYDLIHQIKDGFIEGGGALRRIEENRQRRYAEKGDNLPQDGDYQRNLVVNNESFNVRFKASCATPECLMRNANIDMEDDAFQAYIKAASKDKRSDVIQAIGALLIANPYLKPLEYVVMGDIAYSMTELNLDPMWAFGMGKGAAYRLRLLNFGEKVALRVENVTSYLAGNTLGDD